ncbi:MAG TPA: SRPBCC family protein [Telluria sp.]|jgi:uncharacterized membrane protein
MNQPSEHIAGRQAPPAPWQQADFAPAQAPAAPGALHQGPRPGRASGREQQLGTALGWISVGLGLASLLAPRAVARTAGLPDWPLLMRAVGLREIASGVGLLRQPDNQAWRWARVAGDAMDLAVLGIAAAHPQGDRRRLVSAALALGTLSAIDVRAGNPPRRKLSRQALDGPGGSVQVRESVRINQPPQACYAFWRELERLPSFMQHLVSVTPLDARRSHWCAHGPAGSKVEWDAEITADQPGELLAWQSCAGADVDNAGTVRFAPGPAGKGTELSVELRYRPPAGHAGAMLARLFGEEPALQVRGDLRRFKQLIETGEIPTTKGQSEGKRSLKASLLRAGAES